MSDDLGRNAIARADARLLFAEHGEHKAELARRRAEAEQAAGEADQRWRAQLYHGVPWYQVPDGVAPAAAMLQAAKDDQPRRRTLFGRLLDRDIPNAIPQVFGLSPGDES